MVHIILGGTVFTKKYLPVYPKKRPECSWRLVVLNGDAIFDFLLNLNEFYSDTILSSQSFID